MKRKLWTALLLAALTTVLLSTAAAAEDWGTGGWDVPKRQTDWNPDGVWMEGEYYSVDPAYETKNVQASDDENRDMANHLNYMIAMSWDKDYLYTYISYEEPNGYVVTPRSVGRQRDPVLRYGCGTVRRQPPSGNRDCQGL